MALVAFHNEARVRDDALNRLAAHVGARRITTGSLAWDGEKGSIAGCLAESNDPDAWEARLGLERWIAYVLDTVTTPIAPLVALEQVKTLLGKLKLGADTAPLAGRLIVRVLDEIAAEYGLASELADALAQIRQLYASAMTSPASQSDWRQVRRAAVAATDKVAKPYIEGAPPRMPVEIRDRAIGATIEAAAWDPARSATTASEVLRLWLDLLSFGADSAFGWTNADDERTRSLLEEMHATYIAPNPAEKRDVFQLLEQHHPVSEARLRAYTQHRREYSMRCAERACALLREVLEMHG